MNKKSLNKPIIRWVGGKTQILPELMKKIPTHFDRYFEPFVGGGALLLNLQPKHAIACDLNSELINFYQQVCFDWKSVIQEVRTLSNNSSDYYKIRSWDRLPNFQSLSPLRRAARFLYLNKTSFQGLWRTNKTGFNNVPYGRRKSFIFDDQAFEMFASNMRHVLFMTGDYKALMGQAQAGDFVYFDPPYYLAFEQYVKTGFDHTQHIELRDCCIDLDNKGVKFLLSNSDCDETRKLFTQFNIDTVYKQCRVAAKSASRGLKTEILVSNT